MIQSAGGLIHNACVPDPAPNAELLRSLGQLTRGLSALFWGLPAALIICAETLRADWLKPLGLVPALAALGLLFYGLLQLGGFQKQERPWRAALDRAKLLCLVNFGFCPFLYWQNKMPAQQFFNAAVLMLVLSALVFLFNLNVVLRQLGAMLPDETLRNETRLFTVLNRWLLVGLVLLAAAYVLFLHSDSWQLALGGLADWLNRLGFWALTFLSLLPLALTMALLWKTKEVVLDGVFGPK